MKLMRTPQAMNTTSLLPESRRVTIMASTGYTQIQSLCSAWFRVSHGDYTSCVHTNTVIAVYTNTVIAVYTHC